MILLVKHFMLVDFPVWPPALKGHSSAFLLILRGWLLLVRRNLFLALPVLYCPVLSLRTPKTSHVLSQQYSSCTLSYLNAPLLYFACALQPHHFLALKKRKLSYKQRNSITTLCQNQASLVNSSLQWSSKAKRLDYQGDVLTQKKKQTSCILCCGNCV